MSGYERTLAVKEAAEARLRTLPGVHAVGVGWKSVRGEPTGELCIVVFLERKRPLERLLPHQVVPAVIDGVGTDVVEMAMPRQVAADPAGLKATVAADKSSVEFRGLNKPGAGLLVVLTCTSGPSASPPGSTVYVAFETQDWMTLNKVALTLLAKINEDRSAEIALGSALPLGFTARFPSDGGNAVFIEPTAGNTCAIKDCQVTAVDDEKYFKDHVRGGIQIEPGGKAEPGTLGCLATTGPLPGHPHGLVVAVTCQHVVAQQRRQATNLTATEQNGRITFGNTSGKPIQEGSLVVVGLWDDPVASGGNALQATAFYATLRGEKLEQVAGKVAAAVTALNLPDIEGRQASPADPKFQVTGANPTCAVFGPPPTDEHLGAKVAGLTITLSGDVADDDYGIFTNVNAGGTLATFGVFYQPAKHASLSDVARAIADAINGVKPDAVRGSVKATPDKQQIKVDHAQQVECFVLADCRVGQPFNHFCSSCSPCCSDRIGRVFAARTDVDTALIQLDADREYKTELPGVPGGFQKAPPEVPPESFLKLTAWKLGRTTSLTKGAIDAINVSGLVASDSARSFHRYYTNAMRLSTAAGPYAFPGDSGAAVFTPGGNLLGILFSSSNQSALMTPMSQIIAAFPDLALNFAPTPTAGKAPKAVRVAPTAAPAAAPTAAPAAAPTAGPAATPAAAALAVPRAAMGGSFGRRLVQVEQEITATPAGAAVAAAVRRHFAETERLVNTNRRVATVWHRSGGPQILQAVLDLLRAGRHLPREIDGRPLADCLERIGRVLARYASPALGADVARHGPRLARFSGLTYAEILASLQAEATE